MTSLFETVDKRVWLHLGFRPFLLGAAVFSVLATALWMAVYIFQQPLPNMQVTVTQWHAHEMLYGFAASVIAGFLLTAVQNWTHVRTIHGIRLLGLFSCWAIARILLLCGTSCSLFAAFFDLAFIVWLIYAVTRPIVQAKQWKQLGIVGKLVFLAVGNACFYLGAAGLLDQGIHWSLYGGLFLIIGLIITMGRRVIPLFIESSVGYPVKLFNAQWIDRTGLALYLLFFIVAVFFNAPALTAILSAGLFLTTTARLIGWHTVGIWKKPLLWSLFVALLFIDTGFLLMALLPVLNINPFLVIHLFAFGGIGLITLSMMSRVSTAHTGRSLNNVPHAITVAFIGLIIGCIVRVFLPMLDAGNYILWIGVAQVLWIAAFSIFVVIYAPILVKPGRGN